MVIFCLSFLAVWVTEGFSTLKSSSLVDSWRWESLEDSEFSAACRLASSIWNSLGSKETRLSACFWFEF